MDKANATLERKSSSSVYVSPFETVDFFHSIEAESFSGSMTEWVGLVKGLIIRKGSDTSKRTFNSLESKDRARLIGLAPQIFRPIIELRISNPDSKGLFEAYVLASGFLQFLYKNRFSDAIGELDHCIEKIKASLPKQSDFDSIRISEDGDIASWVACTAKFSKQSVEQMKQDCSGKDIIFIPLANGGVRPGFDVFLRYNSETGVTNSHILPVRFSLHKKHDQSPQVDDLMKSIIQHFVEKGHPIVIFEEDFATEETTKKAMTFFSETFPGAKIVSVRNYDAYS